MVSFIAASNHLGFSAYSVGDSPFFPSLDFLIRRRRQSFISFGPPVAKECGFLGFPGFKRRSLGSPVVLFEKSSCSGSVRRCKSWEEEGDLVLEAEILEFMQKSYNPNVFPTKKEFIDAGRMDLVKAIAKQGGWLALGWDLDEEETGDGFQDSDLMSKEIDDDLVHDDARIFQQRLSLEGIEDEVSSSTTNFSYQDSFSDRSIEMETEEDTGIEGILIRLEKERSKYFGGGSRKKEHSGHVWKNEDKDDWRPKISSDSDTGLGRSSRSTSLSTSRDFLIDTRDRDTHDRSFSDSDERSSSLKSEMWRTWSIQRAGFSNTEFEAAEIVPSESRMGKVVDDMDDEMFTEEKVVNETQNITQELDSGDKEKEYNPIRSRLQNLEVELASVLHLLRSRTDADAVDLHKGHESSLEELQRLSDAWEFQETAIMNTQDKLRSTRAKLAVVEGKMALAIIEAQKMVEEKQKKIDEAQKALRVLRTACIVWPNPASEVLLAGSFDGWASQRKMERSSTGIFSLCLKLYPGRYEIKFIVDGVWRIDPLRPIVRNNGYDNNLLIIS